MTESNNSPLKRLVHELAKLPGIGEKTSLRLAMHILKSQPEYAESLAQAIVDTKRLLKPCTRCHAWCTEEICPVCADSERKNILCVVKDMADLMALERGGHFKWRYHVLHGLLSPASGMGFDSLRMDDLVERIAVENISEVVLALDATIEGEGTSLYLARLLKPAGVRVTKIASGIPLGSDIEYLDSGTLQRALDNRLELA